MENGLLCGRASEESGQWRRQVFGALEKFSLHHNLPSFDLITVDI